MPSDSLLPYSSDSVSGDDFTFFYNEAAIPALQGKHPSALGGSYRVVYKEVWHLVGQDLEECHYRGATVVREDMLIPLVNDGVLQDGWFTYYLIPVFENRRIAGVYDPYQNKTQAVLAGSALQGAHYGTGVIPMGREALIKMQTISNLPSRSIH